MFAGGGIEIEAVVDPSRRAESGLLTGKLNELAFRQMAKSFGDPARMSRMMGSARHSVAEAKDISPANKLLFNLFFESAEKLTTGVSGADKSDGSTGASGSSSPLGGFMPAHVTITELPSRDSNGPRSAYAISFPQGVAWEIRAFARELSPRGLHARRDLLIGKGLGCFLASLAVIVLLTLFSRIILGVTVSEPLRFGVVTIAVSFAFSGLMMLLAGLCQAEGAAQGAGRAVVLILAMIGGGTIPLFFMPKFMATVSSISPSGHLRRRRGPLARLQLGRAAGADRCPRRLRRGRIRGGGDVLQPGVGAVKKASTEASRSRKTSSCPEERRPPGSGRGTRGPAGGSPRGPCVTGPGALDAVEERREARRRDALVDVEDDGQVGPAVAGRHLADGEDFLDRQTARGAWWRASGRSASSPRERAGTMRSSKSWARLAM